VFYHADSIESIFGRGSVFALLALRFVCPHINPGDTTKLTSIRASERQHIAEVQLLWHRQYTKLNWTELLVKPV